MGEYTVAASWNDGNTSKIYEVTAHFAAEEKKLSISLQGKATLDSPLGSEEFAHSWDRAHIRVISQKGQLPLRLSVEPDMGERLIIADKKNAAEVLQWISSASSHGKRPYSYLNWLAVVVFSWLCLGGVYFFSPLFFSTLAQLTSQSWEKRLGERARDQFITGYAILTSTKESEVKLTPADSLDTLVARLRQADPEDPYEYNITVVKAPVVNAFALPGGYIVLFSGLIEECATSDELAGVIAHEMGHVRQRHGLTRYYRTFFWEFFARLGGNSESLGGVMNSIAVLMAESAYSRDMEKEADLLAVERLHAARISADGLSSFFSRLAEKEKDESALSQLLDFSYLHTHPDLADRTAYIQEYQSRLEAWPVFAAIPEKEWLSFKRMILEQQENLRTRLTKEKAAISRQNPDFAEKQSGAPE